MSRELDLNHTVFSPEDFIDIKSPICGTKEVNKVANREFSLKQSSCSRIFDIISPPLVQSLVERGEGESLTLKKNLTGFKVCLHS